MFSDFFHFLLGNGWFKDILIIGCIFLFVFIYINSLNSRKYYKCKSCGEIFRTEHMDALRCNVCGSEVVEIKRTRPADRA